MSAPQEEEKDSAECLQEDEEWLRESPEQAPVARAKPATKIGAIVKLATAMISTRGSYDASPEMIYGILNSHVPSVARTVSMLQQRSNEVWSTDRIEKTFLQELLNVGTKLLNTYYSGDLGGSITQQLIDDSLYTVGSARDGSGITRLMSSNPCCADGPGIGPGIGLIGSDIAGSSSMTGVSGGGAGPGLPSGLSDVQKPLPEGSLGLTARSVFSLDSSSRNLSFGPLPNVIQVPLRGTDGLSLDGALRNISRAELLEVKMNESSILTEQPSGAVFYLRVDELVTDYNRQTDSYPCHFKCAARPDMRGSGVRISILTKWVNMPSAIDLGGNITVRLLDDQKLPLVVEQDVYQYIGYAWDDVNNAIVFQIPKTSIQNADRISIRGITCTEDPTLFDDTNKFRAEVIDLTHIRVYAWRAQGAPFILPDDGRHIVSNNGRIVCINNVIRVSLAFEHIV